ncbi:hypothetical protein PIB30_093528 [Stylosanthes scabra]|uniref:Uncharacterized protein n=1 Tax=Stylosanthes scabra TaxID=79078 RepID=A0ABU6WYE5_9FABA|nr:hypothetical protein [Stylosanthes scabra]
MEPTGIRKRFKGLESCMMRMRGKNPWVGDSHSVYISGFSGAGSSLESWRSILSGMKNEERKLAEQEIKFGSKTEEELHAYAWKGTHMRATRGPTYA